MTPQPSARILVCGGRDYANRARLFAVLDQYRAAVKIEAIVHGAARGADSLADEWATSRGVPVQRFPANWDVYGNAAGPLRNARMLREAEPHLVVAFAGGRGTADMVRRARSAGVRVAEIPG